MDYSTEIYEGFLTVASDRSTAVAGFQGYFACIFIYCCMRISATSGGRYIIGLSKTSRSGRRF